MSVRLVPFQNNKMMYYDYYIGYFPVYKEICTVTKTYSSVPAVILFLWLFASTTAMKLPVILLRSLLNLIRHREIVIIHNS